MSAQCLPCDGDPIWYVGLQHSGLEFSDCSGANTKPPLYDGFSLQLGNTKKNVAA